MRKVTMKEFYGAQAEFIRKHPIAKIETSPMVNNAYSKHYLAEDGAEMWEENRITSEIVEVEVHGVKCQAHVELWETECWSTDDSRSMYLFQAI